MTVFFWLAAHGSVGLHVGVGVGVDVGDPVVLVVVPVVVVVDGGAVVGRTRIGSHTLTEPKKPGTSPARARAHLSNADTQHWPAHRETGRTAR